MKILWLGQGGLLFVSGKTKIMIDPYLSDSLSKHNFEFVRRMKINKKLLKVKPDALIITNSHSDHADIETIERIAKHRKNRKKLTVLSCESVFNELVDIPTVCQANHIMLEEGSEWTIGNINICAVPAKTDDKSAFGVIITDLEDGKKYYATGDTLFNKYIFEYLPNDIYATFLPINGEYGSMNLTDAKRFAQAVNSEFFVPIHFGMFDKINPKEFDLPNTLIPSAYKVINFSSDDTQPYKSGLDFKFNEKDEKKDDVGEKKSVIIYEDTGADATADDTPVIIENEIIEDTDTEISDDIPYEEASLQNIVDVRENESDMPAEDESYKEEYKEMDNDEELDSEEEFDDEEELYSYFDDDDDFEDNDEYSSDDIPFEEGDWSEYISGDGQDDIDEVVDNEDEEFNKECYTPHITDDSDDSDKIDAYIKEIEKFERGETTDFSKID